MGCYTNYGNRLAERTGNEAGHFLPHPGPLPMGEGATSAATRQPESVHPFKRGLRFSLSQRAGVRERRAGAGRVLSPSLHT